MKNIYIQLIVSVQIKQIIASHLFDIQSDVESMTIGVTRTVQSWEEYYEVAIICTLYSIHTWCVNNLFSYFRIK
jgi:hypothetical protein